MQRPNPETTTLNDILITEELSQRSPRSPNLQAENQALRSLARQMARDSENLLQTLTDTALELCQAGTAGVSLLETTPDGEEIFCWTVLAGTLAHHVGGTSFRNFSPCGVCLDQGTPVLFSHPERYFTYFQEANTPVVEGLVLPLVADHHALGTIWIMSHDEGRQFDAEDVRIMTGLADFTATALLLNQRQTRELLAANARLETEIAEHKQTEAKLREAQRRLELSLTGANLGTWTYRIATDEFWADDRALQLHGHQPGEVHTFSSAGANIHPEDYDRGQAVFAEAIQNRSNLQMEYRVIWRDGSVHWIASYAEFVLETNPDDGMFYGVVQDITEAKREEADRKQSEIALQESEEKYRTLVSATSEMVWRADTMGNVISEIPGWERLTGQTFDEYKNFGWVAALHPDDMERISQIWQTAIANQTGATAEYRLRTQTGDYRRVEVRAEPMLNADGNLHGWAGMITDVEEMHRAAEAEQVALNQLRDSELKYRSLFESIDEGFCIFEMIYDETGKVADYRFLEVNPVFERQTGIENPVGKLGSEIAPNTESYWLEAYDAVIKTGKPQRIENYNQSTERWYSAYASRVGGEGSRQVCTVFNDITDRKRAEEQLRRAAELDAFRVKLSDALRSLSDSVEIQMTASRVLREHLGAIRVCYFEAFDQTEEVSATAEDLIADAPPFVGHTYRFTDFEPAAIVEARTGRTTWRDDVTTDESLSLEQQSAYAMTQTRAWVLAPLVKKGRFVACLVAYFNEPHPWTPDEIALLEETAERTWAAVERARAEAALRESEIQRIREQAAREEERQRAESLAELDRAKTNFFSNISHEFRTPLTLMLTPLQDALNSVDEWMSRSVDENSSTHPPIHPSTLKYNLQLVHRNNLRLLKLVNTLLDFSRIEAGRMEAVYEPTDLATFTTELASVFRSAIERAGLQLIVDCPSLLEPVFVDREMWEKIVLNLLSNAFKFTFEGEITVSLRVESRVELQASTSNSHDLTSDPQSPTSELNTSTSELQMSSSELETPTSELETLTSELDASTSELETSSSKPNLSTLEAETPTSQPYVILEIRDTGTGIAPEHLPHLFERFYQVRGTQARTHEGSGIGLALVHELVQLHGGTIDVSSTVGEGTRFTIALPFGKDHLPCDRLHLEGDRIQPVRTLASTAMSASAYVEEAERWLATDSKADETDNFSTESEHLLKQTGLLSASSVTKSAARVLVVDDNADMREYLTRILGEHVQVEAVADGAAALAVAQERVPDLILSDVMMPGLDGFELLEALRADSRTKEVPIILLSARAGEEAIVEGLQAGANDYLIKPFSAQELLSRVTAHLQMAQLRGEALQQERIMNRQKDEFISVVSHELNTPLVSILGWTRLLRSSPSNLVMLDKALDTIERNATLQGKLVQDLLDLSRITAGKLRLNPQPIELQPVIATAIATVIQTATNKGVNLIWQETVTEPLVVMGDSDRLQQVICNLLTNAIKFTPESGSVTLALSVKSGRVRKWKSGRVNDPSTHPPIHSSTHPPIHSSTHPPIHSSTHPPINSYAEIRVIDTGIGISADFLPHVFDRFRQAEDAHSVKGLGLGLAIAQHIIELHDGTIYAESAGEGLGATFTVRLPLVQSRDDLI
jgi:PAS domain S-box-containing protein